MILNVGKHIASKGQQDLIRATAAAATGDPEQGPWLLLIGDGPERDALRSLARETGLRQIVFGGFVRPPELPQYYLAADLYVHPSLADPHPLAITEAVCAGLPVVTTDRVGSVGADDDVQPGRNGWVSPARDWASLGRLLSHLAARPEALRDASAWSSRIYRGRDCGATVAGFVRGVYLAMGRPAPESGSRQLKQLFARRIHTDATS